MNDGDTAGVRAPTVMVIAKAPQPGRVKTRLCPPCTADQAAAIAAAALGDTFAAVGSTVGVRRVVVLDGEPGPWIPEGFEVIEQVSGGLGRRLEAAFNWSVDGPATDSPRSGGVSIVIGMDTPQVGTASIANALQTLAADDVDAVIGPALDGGYWTIGFTDETVARCRGLFEGVPMSTGETYEAQVGRLEALGITYRVLGPLRDVDSFDDAVAVSVEFPELATSAVVAEVMTGLRVGTSDNSTP